MMYYKLGAKGLVQYEIFPFEDGYMSVWGKVGGVQQEKFTEVFENESGRTHSMQVKLEIASKVKRMKDRGYKDTKEEAMKGATTQDGYHRPMLAAKYDDSPIPHEAHIQYKYDGHRCLMYNDGDKIVAYSRGGQEIMTVQHIKNTIAIPYGCTLDGELYVHGASLQGITSLIKRHQADCIKLKYMVYDSVLHKPFSERFAFLESLQLGPHAEIAPTWKAGDIHIKQSLDGAIIDGYEGLMIRHDGVPYETGKRSKSLVKVKSWLDEEFIIRDIEESADGWAVLVFDNFSATAPGTIEEKTEILEDAELYIGQKARVEYSKLTNGGVPFHPVVTNLVD